MGKILILKSDTGLEVATSMLMVSQGSVGYPHTKTNWSRKQLLLQTRRQGNHYLRRGVCGRPATDKVLSDAAG